MKSLNEQTIKRLQKLAGIKEIKITKPKPIINLEGKLSLKEFTTELPIGVGATYRNCKFNCELSGRENIQIYPSYSDGITFDLCVGGIPDTKSIALIKDMIENYEFDHYLIDELDNGTEVMALVTKFEYVMYNGVSLKDYQPPEWY